MQDEMVSLNLEGDIDVELLEQRLELGAVIPPMPAAILNCPNNGCAVQTCPGNSCGSNGCGTQTCVGLVGCFANYCGTDSCYGQQQYS